MDFQNLVAKTLYATKRAIPDTCTSIAYLTTRIQTPNDKDWDKLLHMMQYIRVTRKLSLTLTVNGSEILKWWVGALFAVHINMRVYSGGGLSLGRGFPIVISTEQKLNTKTFTETEIFGVDYLIPDICWTQYLVTAQSYNVKDDSLHHNNKGSIILENNWKT